MPFTTFPIPSAELSTVAADARTAIGAMQNTNAAVNTAISSSPSATRRSLAIEKGRFGAAATAFRTALKDLRVVMFGDSVSINTLNLSGIYPQAGGYCRPDDSADVSGTSLVTDWVYPGGRYASIPSGATRRWGVYNISAADQPFKRASKFRIYYIVGTGTLRLRSATGTSTSFSDITGHTAIDCSVGTAGSIAVREVTLTNSNFYRIDTVADAGTVKIVGVEALEATTGNRDSYYSINLGLGGSFDYQWAQTTQANWNTMLQAMQPHLIVFKAWEGHINLAGTDWSTTLDRIRAADPNAVLVLVGTHPTNNYPDPLSDSSGVDAAFKAYAETNSSQCIFIETRRYWPHLNLMLASKTVTADASTNAFTATNHELQTGDPVTFSNSGGALPSGISGGTTYYTIRLTANTFSVGSTLANAIAGSAIDITTNGTGTNSFNRPNGLISADGVHLIVPQGTAYQNSLILDCLSSLVAAPEFNEDLTTPIRYRIAGPRGVINSKFSNGPLWEVGGDLTNANGDIGFSNTVGTAANFGGAPTFRAFSANNTNIRLANGYGFGRDTSNFQIAVTRNNESNRIILGNLGNVESSLTRLPSGRLEVLGNGTSEPALTVSVPTGQTANVIEVRTASSLSATGTAVSGFTKDGCVFAPSFTTAQRDALTSVTAGSIILNTTTGKLNFYTGSAWEAITSI